MYLFSLSWLELCMNLNSNLLYPIILRINSNWTSSWLHFFLRSSYDFRYAILLVIRFLEDCTKTMLILLSCVFSLSPQKYLVVNQLEPYCTLFTCFDRYIIHDNTSQQSNRWGHGFSCAYGIVASIKWLQQLIGSCGRHI